MYMYIIKLEYFKRNGTYYSEGTYETKEKLIYKIRDEVITMRDNNKLPGVVGGDFIIHINADSIPDGFPCVIL